MTHISAEQLKFINDYNIPLSKVFDAAGLTRLSYKKIMSDTEMLFAIGVTPCQKSGHTMRTLAGACVECKPENIGYLLRHNSPGEVYVAFSKSTNMVKIGTGKNAKSRMKSLNQECYGQASDWELQLHQHCKKAGHVEYLIQNELKKYHTNGTYTKGGREQECYELFKCDVDIASIVATKIFSENNIYIKKDKVVKKDTLESANEIQINIPNAGIQRKKRMRDQDRPIIHKYAEVWLNEAVELLRPIFSSAGYIIPPVFVSVGFGIQGMKSGKKGVILGVCHRRELSNDDVFDIYIAPLRTATVDVLIILSHELIHAVDNCVDDHGLAFNSIAKAIGHTDVKNCSEIEHDSYIQKMFGLADQLGRYPRRGVKYELNP